MSSDSAATLGIGGCGTASQTQTVTGVAAKTLELFVYACAEGGGTVTAELRSAGSTTSLATVSQRLSVEAVPELAPGSGSTTASTAKSGSATVRSAARVGTPGTVPSISFPVRTTTSIRASWGKPSNGGRRLTGFGLLFWRTSDPDPAYSSALVKGDPAARSHVFTGLQPDTTYKFRIHACNGPDSCGWWTHPPKEVSTPPEPPPPPPTATATATAAPVGRPDAPHTLSFDEIKATSARANWNIAANTGGVALTGFGLLRWPTGTAEPPHSEAIVVGDGGATDETMTGLMPETKYVFKMRACNGPNRCSDWTANQTFTTLAGTVTPGRVTNLRHSSSGDNSVTLAWNAPGNSAAAAVTSYHVQNRPLEAAWPGGFDVAQGAGTTTFTVSQLVDGTIYEFQVRACNAAGCGDWNTLGHPDHVIVAGHKVGNASLIPASASLAVGARLGVGIHDIPKGKVAYAQMYGAIQPAGRCSTTRGTQAVARAPSASTGSGYYDTVNIEGCAPGGIGWLRVVNAAETELYARATIRVGQARPAKVLAPTVIPGNEILTVRWYAPNDGGSAITEYRVAWPGNEQSVGQDARSYVITGLTNGTAYAVKVRACNTVGCGDWSDEVEGTPAITPPGEIVGPPPGSVTTFVPCGTEITGGLAKPADLTIAPVPQRQAVLMWSGTTGAEKYVVQVRRYGSQAWNYPVHGDSTSAEVRDACYTINLDIIMTLAGGATEGLADEAAYQFRVTARDTSNAGIVSDIATIIDTPITRANGDSRGAHSEIGPGLAEIIWTPVDQKVPAIASGGTYQLRHRLALGDHTLPGWEPSNVSAFADPVTNATSPQRVIKLKLNRIYAIQLTYDSDNSGTPDVFAARDVYVYPERYQADSGDRIAGFPVVQHLTDKTFTYRICPETFAVEGETRKNAWVRLVRDAFGRWQNALTADLVPIVEESGPCTSYADIAARWAWEITAEVQRLMQGNPPVTDLDTIADRVEAFVRRMREEQMGGWPEFRARIATLNNQDKSHNEVLLFDDENADLKSLIKYRIYDELSGDLGATHACWYALGEEPGDASACADSQGILGPFVIVRYYTTDIFFRRSAFVSGALDIPGPDARMNICGFVGNRGGINSAFSAAMHEIGHALGISSDGRTEIVQWRAYAQGHPPDYIVDTIMSYNTQPRCGQYPLDLMVIHALYQTVD